MTPEPSWCALPSSSVTPETSKHRYILAYLAAKTDMDDIALNRNATKAHIASALVGLKPLVGDDILNQDKVLRLLRRQDALMPRNSRPCFSSSASNGQHGMAGPPRRPRATLPGSDARRINSAHKKRGPCLNALRRSANNCLHWRRAGRSESLGQRCLSKKVRRAHKPHNIVRERRHANRPNTILAVFYRGTPPL